MSDKLEYSSTLYEDKFKPETYLDMFYKTVEGNPDEKDFADFFLKNHHAFWSKKYQPTTTKQGEVCCLEFGGGPVVSNLISVAPKVDYIVFAEFVKENRQSVSNWVEGKPGGHDWMSFFQYIVNDLEGNKGEEAIVKREQELKRKITSVVPCDVMKSPIVDLGVLEKDKLFDVVFTSLCLEACVLSVDHYKAVVKSLVEYLKPGGYLIMSGVLQQTFYFVGDEKYYTFYLTPEMVEEAMMQAGCHDIFITTAKLEETGIVSDCQALFFCHGKK